MKDILIPVILGPTASGKTSIGIELAKKIHAEIISIDSRKVYKGLPIGTATPRGKWVDGAYYVHNVAHHLMGHLAPDDFYTAGDFANDASQLILEILARDHVPLLVGGTGFYFKALQKGLPQLPTRNEKIRRELEDQMEEKGLEVLFNELKNIDPDAADSISSGDRHKIIRALEVYRLTGQPFSQWNNAPRKPSPFRFVVMGLEHDKDLLEQRIEERSLKMFKRGMIKEAETLMIKGYPKTCPALSSFGYREAVQVIEGALPEKDFLPLLIKGTKAYAKRQRTWFRTQVQPHWFPCSQTSRKRRYCLENE